MTADANVVLGEPRDLPELMPGQYEQIALPLEQILARRLAQIIRTRVGVALVQARDLGGRIGIAPAQLHAGNGV